MTGLAVREGQGTEAGDEGKKRQRPAQPAVPEQPLTDGQQAFVEANLGLVYTVAGRHSTLPGQVYEDLIQRLSVRLCRVARRWDPTRGFRPSTYIMRCLSNEVKNFFRDEGWTVRPPRSTREQSLQQSTDACDSQRAHILSCASPLSLADCSPQELARAEGTVDVEALALRELAGSDLLVSILQALRPEERTILCLRMKRRSVQELALRFGIPHSTAWAMWEELRKKCQGYFRLYQEGVDLPGSQGNRVLNRALKRKAEAQGVLPPSADK